MATPRCFPASPSRNTALAMPKLRDSCNRCAASKLKCSKDKPTCARCAKRGMLCEYFLTKRAGRKQGSRTRNRVLLSPSSAPPLPPISPPVAPDISTVVSSWTTLLSEPNSTNSTSIPNPLSHANISSSIFSLSNPTISTPTTSLDYLNFDFDDFPVSPVSFSMLELPDMGEIPEAGQFEAQNHNSIDFTETAIPAATDDSFPAFVEAATPQGLLLPSSAASQGWSDSRPLSIDDDDSGLTCNFVRALDLLRKLSSPMAHSCSLSHEGQAFEINTEIYPLPRAQSKIATIEKSVQTISDILQCQCSDDEYLLAILSIITLKILTSYTAIVRQQTASRMEDDQIMYSHRRESFDNNHSFHLRHGKGLPNFLPNFAATDVAYGAESEDQNGSMISRNILSQLHRVQRLVNILCQRFKKSGQSSRCEGRPKSFSSCSSGPSNNRLDALSFSYSDNLFSLSGSLLDQMEVDMRTRLRNLAAEIVDILR
ncbi:hypothetical protein BGW36DRAFT_403776 [Talaromyces proteolyticus]|uniref:Zn(2)-C6 fungal-type domain-containing protein n=1 Tax=Talaromyces proteolyticus TaxID=1131652 RepID=A0AAD4KXH8_9EURO|nr:uncharacterized protein BGW36DRAFT_403776 [Talaromyces proteolyticus]KAH8703360.1 hypothetical protein BGW36DRAFT_403776 [Talaromyces proteolyticus]